MAQIFNEGKLVEIEELGVLSQINTEESCILTTLITGDSTPRIGDFLFRFTHRTIATELVSAIAWANALTAIVACPSPG